MEKRKGFMTGVRNDFAQAVYFYERSFGNSFATDPQEFVEWKSKYGYIKDFVNFRYTNLKLDKQYIELINKYHRYMNQQNL